QIRAELAKAERYKVSTPICDLTIAREPSAHRRRSVGAHQDRHTATVAAIEDPGRPKVRGDRRARNLHSPRTPAIAKVFERRTRKVRGRSRTDDYDTSSHPPPARRAHQTALPTAELGHAGDHRPRGRGYGNGRRNQAITQRLELARGHRQKKDGKHRFCI
ncbi:hypothetical protein RF55_6784, partial [Lasius niger]